jgi:hypothetical protein
MRLSAAPRTTREQRLNPQAPEDTMAPRKNLKYLIVATIVRIYMLGALAISFNHIITAASMVHLTGWQAWTAPFVIDGFAVLGMIGRSRSFATTTQRTGLLFQAGAGVLSLTCNIYAGHTLGERIYGAAIVSAFVAAEYYAGKLFPATPAETETPEQVAAAKRSAAAKQAAITRAANKAAQASKSGKAAAQREHRRLAAATKRAEAAATKELEKMAAGEIPANAPTSPALGYL